MFLGHIYVVAYQALIQLSLKWITKKIVGLHVTIQFQKNTDLDGQYFHVCPRLTQQSGAPYLALR